MTAAYKHMKIAPSLLSADFSKLQEEISRVEKAGADLLHLDVMDGHFVPNLTIGPFIVKAINRCTDLTLDCHLMIEEPEKYVEAFINAGADMVSIHAETSHTTVDLIKTIQSLGAKAGIAINPDTPLDQAANLIRKADYVLIMSVHPGFGGQSFIKHTVDKVKALKSLRSKEQLAFEIEVDGGIKTENIHTMARAGANIFVSGSNIFKSGDYQQTISKMKEKIHD